MVRSPRSSKSTIPRNERPISRWISTVLPSCRPRVASLALRSPVEAGSMPYSAVTHPRPVPLIQRGTPSWAEAVQITRVSPIEIRAEPVAVRMKPGSIVVGRSSSGARPWLRSSMRSIIPERYGRGTLRALVLSNMLPDRAHPERGRFVRDQVAALRRLEGLEVQLHEFPPGARSLGRSARELHRRFATSSAPGADRGGAGFDVVHSHFGLTAWPALAVPARVRALTVHGTDLRHPRTRLATAAVLPLMDVLGAASASLAAELPTHAARRRALVLPCGVDTGRFHPLPRAEAREELGLEAQAPYLLFPADPSRPGKRHDLALALARATGAQLLSLGGVDPARVPLWVNAANAVLVPSDQEGFGLAVLEALACDVPVLATPVGIHADALRDVPGTLCAPFDLDRWGDVLREHLRSRDPRVPGRASAERFSAGRMAERVSAAWREAVGRSG